MGGWLKALIAAACVVIVAGGAYFAWSEYQQGLGETERNRTSELARAELFEWAGAKPHEFGKVRAYCADIASRLSPGDTASLTRRLVRNCSALGYR